MAIHGGAIPKNVRDQIDVIHLATANMMTAYPLITVLVDTFAEGELRFKKNFFFSIIFITYSITIRFYYVETSENL